MSLSILKKILLQDSPDPSDVLTRYSEEVRECFRNPGRLSHLNVDQFTQETPLRQWEDSQKSCMILLQGRTAITTRDYSYLSPATFHLIDWYRRQRCRVIFHCCHDKVFMDKDTPLHVVLSSLIYQMLDAESPILRDQLRFEKLKQQVSDPAWRSGSPKLAFAVLGELLDIVSEVYIFLDRIDRIKGPPDRFMEPLVRLIKSATCNMKVFCTASSNNQDNPEGKMTSDFLENIQEELGPQRFFSLMMNQK